MATAGISLLSFLFSSFPFFFLLFFSAHSTTTPTLHRTDRDAILAVQRALGCFAVGQRGSSAAEVQANPCTAAGIHCEPRIWNGSSVLRVTRVVLQSRRLTGVLSPAIGRLSELTELSLSNNQLADKLPRQIADCGKLEVLNLRKNRFSGEVPPELSSLLRLRVIDLSSNKFSGNLNFLKHFPNLEKLFIADNHFSGRVPASLRSFRNLRLLDASGNAFLEVSAPLPGVKQQPSSLGSSIPRRYVFAERSNSTGAGRNGSTAVAPAQAPGPSSPNEDGERHRHRKKKVWAWIVSFLVGAIAGSLSGLVFSVLFKLLLLLIRGKGKDTGPQMYSSKIKREDLAFLEKEDGVASLQCIGSGGCGEVYKAELAGSEIKVVAIKKVVQPQRDPTELAEEESKQLHKKMRQIRAEINSVSKIRHRNLLSLLAHVCRPDCHFLVYEFMRNGSLQDLLVDAAEGRRVLDWPTRIKVALGVAAGLEYLHTSQSPRIIHRDLKPANVLLDDDMEARIADFGLAKAMPEANTHVTSSNVAGTVGYIAPEYHQTLKFTDKCDVYSFGVLLGVLVTGKLPSDDFFQGTPEVGLVKWMRNVMTSDDPKRAIDQILVGKGFDDQILLMLKVACFCTRDDPKQRPNSKEARCMLAQIDNPAP